MSKSSCNVGICTTVKNRASFLQEWIYYHQLIGVEKFFIYRNNGGLILKFILVLEIISVKNKFNIV